MSRSEAKLSRAVQERYLCPQEFFSWKLLGPLSHSKGYFSVGDKAIAYGHSCAGELALRPDACLHDLLTQVVVAGGDLKLPFDPSEIIENARLERYSNSSTIKLQAYLKKVYYVVRPFMNVAVRSVIQRFRARGWEKAVFPRWPVDTTVEDLCEKLLLLSMTSKNVKEVPFIWFWPNGASSCICMTHDVETESGRAFCCALMDLNDSFGVKSSFQVIPEERYEVTPEFLQSIRSRGFEVAVHDLNHDGRLYDQHEKFLRRAQKINQYAAQWQAGGFRAGALYRNPDWFDSLNFSYEMSTPNVGHLDPQSGGCCTVMPYFIGDMLEIPVTMIQDYMLFHLFNQRSIDQWKTQSELILKRNGMMTFIVHPDYILEEETRSVYSALLAYLRELKRSSGAWIALPREIDNWWRARSKMQLVRNGESWRIEGEGAERAILAYARNENGTLRYELESAACTS